MLKEYQEKRTSRRPRIPQSKRLRYCAVLVDFENIYYTLSNDAALDAEPIDETAVDDQALDEGIELLSNLRVRLREKYSGVMAIGRSYADFDRLGSDVMTQLQLLAFEPRFMLGTKHRGSSEILLSIDAVEMLLTRPELDMFVIVGGDRDFLPVVRRLHEHLKRVIVVGFGKSTSGDLRQIVGEENYINADYLLPYEAPAGNGGGERRTFSRPAVDEDEESGSEGPEPVADVPINDEDLKLCMEELLNAYYQYGERKVWLTPFLRMLNDRFPYLDNRGRKRMVEDLQAKGAISIEKIEGDPYPYSVVEINWDDAWVQSLDEGRGNT